MIDTHCHFDVKSKDLLKKELKEIYQNGVEKLIVSCCTKEEQMKNIPLLLNEDMVYLSLGFHPEEAGKISTEDLNHLEKMLKSLPRVVAVGEIGLDYFYTKDQKKEQIQLFESQLKIAERLHLPVVIHSRDATEDTINLLQKYKINGVIHCFSGSLETAKIYMKMGFFLGIGGVVTFKNSHLKEVLSQIPLESILLETDSPYLTPVPYRGKENSPKYLPIIAQFIADLKQKDIKIVEEITNSNCKQIFHI